jgi:hypothetical protein
MNALNAMLRQLLYWIYSRRFCELVLTHGHNIHVAVPGSFISQQAVDDITRAVHYGKKMWKERICAR